MMKSKTKTSFFSAVDSPTPGAAIDMEIDLIAAGGTTVLADNADIPRPSMTATLQLE